MFITGQVYFKIFLLLFVCLFLFLQPKIKMPPLKKSLDLLLHKLYNISIVLARAVHYIWTSG